MEDLKRILIVDDSAIDREVLRSMLNEEFEVVEVDNGYSALDVILKKGECFDAVLLDVSMPLFDGISVLRTLRENNLNDVQIFMITVEATKENIEKASQYNIAEFIRKPFDRNEVLRRVRAKLGVAARGNLTRADMDETKKYAADLKFIYDRYLSLSGQDRGRDERRARFMKILLEKARTMKMAMEPDDFRIEMICKAAYLCNMGNMLLQNMSSGLTPVEAYRQNQSEQQHPAMGAYIARLNYSKHCRWFVNICSEICLRHHERFDGKGFPHGVTGNKISVYAQICGLLEKFDGLFFRYSIHTESRFDRVISQLQEDRGIVNDNVFLLLSESRFEIVKYCNGNDV